MQSLIILTFDILVTFIENYLIIKMIDLFFEKKRNISFIAALIITSLSYLMNMVFKDVNIASIILIFFNFLYAYLFLEGSISKKIVSIILVYINLMVINLIVVLLGKVFGLSIENYFLQFNQFYVLIISFQKIIFLIEYVLLRKYLSKDIIISNKTTISIITLLFILITFTMFILSTYIAQIAIKQSVFYFLIFIIVFTCFLIFYIYNSMLNDYKKMINQEILIKTTKQEERLLNLLNKKITEINKLNHDFNNHKIVIDNLIKNNETDILDNYMSEYKTVSYINTDNPVLNYMINEKIEFAKQYNIDIKCMIKGSYKSTISNVDLCIILGNLLDNAIEAAKITEEKYISLKIKQDEYKLFINVENSYKELEYKNNKYISTKRQGRHGFGLSNIKLICNKYNGSDSIKHEKNIFSHCCILLLKQ